jgi:hypothetical protein
VSEVLRHTPSFVRLAALHACYCAVVRCAVRGRRCTATTGERHFTNSCTAVWPSADPSREEDAAREAPFPFTTIQPNVGRGHIVLPDPAPLLGLTADTAQPAHGYALGEADCCCWVC